MRTLRVLLIEDSDADADLLVRGLENAGFTVRARRIASEGQLREALDGGVWDVALSDYDLAEFSGLEALDVIRDADCDIPLIIVASGNVGEETTASLMRRGVGDYLTKNNLTRLAPAVIREMQVAENRRVKREAEKALEESEVRLQMALSAAGMGAWEWDLKTDAVYWSPEASVILGIPIAGTQAQDVHRLIFDEDRDLVAEKYRLAIIRRSSFTVRFRIKRRDGELIWVSEHGKCEYDGKGTPIRMVGTLRDITREKKAEDALIEAEEKYRTVIESAADAVISIDDDSTILFANAAAETVFGYSRAELVGEHISIIQPENLREAHNAGFGRFIRTNEKHLDWRNVETVAVRKDGTLIDVHLSFGVFRSGKRRVFTAFIRDVTQKKIAENAIRQSEKDFRALIDATTQFVWQLDERGNLTSYPQWWIELTGQDFETSRNYGWVQRVHPDDRERVRSEYESALANGTPVRLDLRIRDVAGNYRHYNARGVPIPAEDDGRPRWICAMVEFTKQHAAEQELMTSRERYRIVSSISTDYMFSTGVGEDGELKLDWLAGAFDRITGYTQDEFVKHGGWRAIVHPADRQIDADDFEALTNNRPVDSELRIVRKDGETIWIRTIAQPIWDEKKNRLTGICGAVQDITARKAVENSLRDRERHLRAVLDAEPECVKVFGLTGEILEMNRAGLVFLEAESPDHVIGKNAEEFIPSEHVEKFRQALITACRGESSEFSYEIKGLRGTRRWMEMNAVPMRDESGEIVSVISVSRDITERMRAEQELRQQAMLLRNSSEAILVWDFETGIIHWNDGCERLYGYTREEAIGRFGYDLLESKFPISREEFLAQLREKRGWAGQISQTARDGRTVFADSRFEVTDFDGRDIVLQTNRDVTEKIRAEASLRESEERYRHLFENNPYPMWVYDIETLDFLAVNDAAVFRYGYSREEFLSMSILDIRPAEDAEMVREKARSTTPRIDRSGLWRHTKKNGEIINVEINSHALDFEGHAARLVLANDVTERLRAEAALRSSEERYRDLVENANDLIYTHNLNGDFTSLNRAGERITGYTEAEVLKMNVSDFLSPEEMKIARRLMLADNGDNNHSLFEVAVQSKEGRSVFLEINIRLIRQDGKPVGVQGVGRDVTERKLAEEEMRRQRERLDKATETAPAAIYSFCVRPDGFRNFIYASTAVEKIYGFTFEQLRESGEAVLDRIHAADIDDIEKALVDSMRDLSPVHVTFRYAHPEGRLVWIEAWASPTLEKDGSYIFHSIATEVTEQKAAEEALHLSEQQLQQAQKLESIGILAGGMAHDFNNMLTAINGYSDLILRKLKSDDPIRRNIEEIRKAGERSAELTRQLLAFSRRQIMVPRVLNINEVIEETSTMLRRLIGENIHVTTKLAPDLGSVEADPGQLSQILVNFVINSRDAMPNGGSIVIETANVELDENYASRHVSAEPGDYVMLAVSDTGTGMDEATRQRVFEPFFTTKEVGHGTGLGLSTVYGIVKQSGGNIWVYSEPGKGTTFKIYLPRVSQTVTPNHNADFRNSMRGTETILLVEDEEAVRSLSREILETCGYTVIEAANGAEALDLAGMSKVRIDLLMTDIVMPELGGRELAEILVKKRPTLKVLFTSGYTDDAILRHGIIDEGTNFLQKPFTFDGLSKMIRSLLDS